MANTFNWNELKNAALDLFHSKTGTAATWNQFNSVNDFFGSITLRINFTTIGGETHDELIGGMVTGYTFEPNASDAILTLYLSMPNLMDVYKIKSVVLHSSEKTDGVEIEYLNVDTNKIRINEWCFSIERQNKRP